MFRSDTAGTGEANQYDGIPESASTIAQAPGLNMVQQFPRAAVYTLRDRLQFLPGRLLRRRQPGNRDPHRRLDMGRPTISERRGDPTMTQKIARTVTDDAGRR
ncbi:hypothetical protein [Mycolicibacterium sphagni]|uniref:Uncharacterized protein n=1 Tax=Mycolicibacterium sphagni TaxID=1786 RepID=A0ABX2K4J1_9MYCO|nr:hypothetical protein [Mycolicibacterium sphagni]NTY62630.1 hypothetical protein [Mycolicibacterium sphagni]